MRNRSEKQNLSARKTLVDSRFKQFLFFDDNARKMKREVMMWRTVLIQTMRDAAEGDKEAFYYFSVPEYRQDLEHVCELCFIHPDYANMVFNLVLNGEIVLPMWRRIRNLWRGEPEKERKKRK